MYHCLHLHRKSGEPLHFVAIKKRLCRYQHDLQSQLPVRAHSIITTIPYPELNRGFERTALPATDINTSCQSTDLKRRQGCLFIATPSRDPSTKTNMNIGITECSNIPPSRQLHFSLWRLLHLTGHVSMDLNPQDWIGLLSFHPAGDST